MAKTYSTRDSPVVTHPSTSLAIVCLSRGERTGSRVLRRLWPYVIGEGLSSVYKSSVLWTAYSEATRAMRVPFPVCDSQ